MARVVYLKTARRDAAQRLAEERPRLTLGEFLADSGCEMVTPDPSLHGERLADLQLLWVQGGTAAKPSTPPGSTLDALWQADAAARPASRIPPASTPEGTAARPTVIVEAPEEMSDELAVYHAYTREIGDIAKALDHALSVLVTADKILVEHLLRQLARFTTRPLVRDDDGAATAPAADPGARRDLSTRVDAAMEANISRAQQIGRRLQLLKTHEALVIRHLDLMTAAGGGGSLTGEARQLAEVLYARPDRALVGFVDPALDVPEIIRKRFPIRVDVTAIAKDALGRMVTRRERARFREFDPGHLYKNVSGLNAVEFRNAMRYVAAECADGTPARRIYDAIRLFKRSQSSEVQIPDVTFEQIGGYDEVKARIDEVIRLMTNDVAGADENTERLAMELTPRGILFHGPPGTGKTLFSKAIANRLNATIQIVSGPEIMSKFVGESEERVRHLFSVARKNAPAVIVFDEFDSIAFHRGGGDDGASRASNAVVAQLLTEMDGFRGDQQVLVIGTTNRTDIIDPAFLRPSRLTPIEIPLPDEAARRRIIEIYLAKFAIPRAPEIEACLPQLVGASRGFNGDDLQSVFRDAKSRELLHRQPVTPALLLELTARVAERKTHGRRDHL